MITAKVSSKVPALTKAIEEEMHKAAVAAAHDIGTRFLGFHRAQRMRGQRPGVKATTKGLVAQLGYTINDTPGNVTVTMGSKSPIVRQLEEGVTYTQPRTIPFSSMGKARKKTIREKSKARKLVMIRRRDGKRFLADPKFGRGFHGVGFSTRRDIRALEFVATVARNVVVPPLLGFKLKWQEWQPKAVKRAIDAGRFALKAARRRVRG